MPVFRIILYWKPIPVSGSSCIGQFSLLARAAPNAKLKESMAAKPKPTKEPMPPFRAWAGPVALGWLIPGGGHFLLKRNGRGVLLMLSITLMYLCGLMMRGNMFQPQFGDLLTIVINVGGFIGDLANGLLYLLTNWLGYNQPEVAGPVHDYGTKFLVTGGLLNILAMVDAFEIAAGRKN
jgi:hypothetical protein